MVDDGGEWARAVARDWPALETVESAGWRLGYSHGVSKRANSAVALHAAADPDEPARFYRERGLRSTVQVWPGQRRTDALLAERGYRIVDPSLVLTRQLAERPEPATEVVVGRTPPAGWTEAVRRPDGADTHAAAVEARITARSGMVHAVHADGRARGCAALNGDLVGVYGMATRADSRRRGCGNRVLDSLLAWAHDHGARRAYLLVVADNTAARALYEKAGFTEAARYHYRVLEV
ncbi:GNAT family N-acetyltransferase [Thermobifida halotolerans]|uniref:GNAT family N-acetyltransferase n=1 Tax=Thermobifida halotolerans TaxID=483545 RepID=A0A399G5X3_9ACTN|nr:GNAT family N-acetyltransferase [Thermobifida halotolerans]UOE17843.1 GNAT family N-acetyltransferase [Thermobifida halotolerans]